MDVDGAETDARHVAARAAGAPVFPPLSAREQHGGRVEMRRVLVPPHRMTPLRHAWMRIYTPVVEHMKLQIRMNLRTRQVEIRVRVRARAAVQLRAAALTAVQTCAETRDPMALQKAADFVRAFMLGFDIDDAVALLRLDELYIDTFEICDVKPLKGDHLSRAIGRIAGRNGRTKFTIENATKTRIVLADSKIHILGAVRNIRMAKDAVVGLILGSPPGKVYGQLRAVTSRANERY